MADEKMIIKQMVVDGVISQEIAEKYCPELIESEDERIRKGLMSFLEDLAKLGKNTNFDKWNKSDCTGWIKWIEKQGKKNRAEWSEEDTKHVSKIISFLEECESYHPVPDDIKIVKNEINWVKSLRPQNGWKPSEAQINALEFALNRIEYEERPLIKELLADLLVQIREL